MYLKLWLIFIWSFAVLDGSVGRNIKKDHKDAPHVVSRRSSSTDFYNFYDEMASSICTSLPPVEHGFRFAVRRQCGEIATCKDICASSNVRSQIHWSWTATMKSSCIDSLHLYKGRPKLDVNPNANTDVHKIGLLTWRYNSCTRSSCGPNYCCCKMLA